MDELKRGLREAAEAHHPDRARIHARVERGMAATRDRSRHPPAARSSWARVAGATAAVAAVLAAGVHTAATVPGSDRPARSATAQPTAPLSAEGLTALGAVDPHSNRFWAQNNITLTAPRPLTALTVDLRVAHTGGVASTGHWRTLPAEDFTVSVREDEGGALHYTWTLKPGRTAPAGRHVFAGQYNHAEGARAAGRDHYTVTATDSGGERTSLRGDFAR